jgi:hypothetical protein
MGLIWESENVKIYTREPCKSLNTLTYITSNNLSEMCTNIVIALKILLTTPVSVALVQWSFSRLELIKNYLQSISY